MRFHTLVCGAAAVVMTAGCDAATDVAGPGKAPATRPNLETTTAQDVPWGHIVANTCNGDEVTITGTTHFVTHASLDSRGDVITGSHYDVSAFSKGTGVGLAPALKQYTGQSTNNESYQLMDPTTSVIVQDIERVIGPQATDNFYLHFQWKVTVTATGAVAVDRVKDPEVRCNG